MTLAIFPLQPEKGRLFVLQKLKELIETLFILACLMNTSLLLAEVTNAEGYVEVDFYENDVQKLKTDGLERGLYFEISLAQADSDPVVLIGSHPEAPICTLESIENLGSTELLQTGEIIYHFGIYIATRVITDSGGCLIQVFDENKLVGTIDYFYAI